MNPSGIKKNQDFDPLPHTPVNPRDENSNPNACNRVAQVATSRVFDSPKRYYDVDSSLRVQFSPGAKKYSRGKALIYKIKHKETKLAKVGLTYQGIEKRTQQHLSCARHPEKDRGQSELYEAMRRSPTKFQVGVVATLDEMDVDGDSCDEYEKLGKLETAVILDHGTLDRGFNKVKGGAGGTISEEPDTGTFFPPESYLTPEKSYKIKQRKIGRGRRLFVDSSPRGAKKTHIVYGFRRDDGKWLIGETTQSFRKRMYGYHHAFNHPEKDVGKMPLPTAVREDPSRWSVHILYEGPHIKQMERLWIEAKNSIENGFNQVKGGGGPTGKKYRGLL